MEYDAAKYWNLPADERREVAINAVSQRVLDGVPLEEVPDFLLLDRLGVELAMMVREKRELTLAGHVEAIKGYLQATKLPRMTKAAFIADLEDVINMTEEEQ